MTLKGPFDPNRIAYNPQVDNRLLDENKPEEWHENNFTVKDAQAYQRLNSTQEHTELRGPTLRFYDDKISKEIYGVKQNKNYLKKKKKKPIARADLFCFGSNSKRPFLWSPWVCCWSTWCVRFVTVLSCADSVGSQGFPWAKVFCVEPCHLLRMLPLPPLHEPCLCLLLCSRCSWPRP